MQDPLPDSMFQDDEFNKLLDLSVASKVRGKGKTPLHIALEAVHLYEKAKALATPQDSVGVLFYNVDVSKPTQPIIATLKTLLSPTFYHQHLPMASGLKLSVAGLFSINP
jgi:hypothetical protein